MGTVSKTAEERILLRKTNMAGEVCLVVVVADSKVNGALVAHVLSRSVCEPWKAYIASSCDSRLTTMDIVQGVSGVIPLFE